MRTSKRGRVEKGSQRDDTAQQGSKREGTHNRSTDHPKQRKKEHQHAKNPTHTNTNTATIQCAPYSATRDPRKQNNHTRDPIKQNNYARFSPKHWFTRSICL